MKYIKRYHDFESFINDYEDDEKYIEPWVSFCNEQMVVEFIVECSQGQTEQDDFMWGAKFNSKDGDFYKWDSYRLPGKSQPGYSNYWTLSQNPQLGDKVFCSVNGAQEDSECAYVRRILNTKTVSYNKDTNWIRVGYAEGSSSQYAEVIEWGAGFDNSENSTYYVYNDNTGEETTYEGVSLYWDTSFCSLYVDEIPCYGYYYIEESDGEWIMEEGYRPCEY